MMEKEHVIKRDEEQINQTNNSTRVAISRRQFSAGLSGVLIAGSILAPAEHDTFVAHSAKIFNNPSPQSELQKLASRDLRQPQFMLSGATASVWSPDSQHIATFQENVVMLYDANTGKSELTYRKHTDEILTMKWSADGKYLASSGFDRIVHVWDAMSGQTVTMYPGHTDIVRDVAWSPDQHYIASAGYDKTVQIWEAFTGNMVVTCSGHDAEIQTLTWSPDGKFIASADLQNRTLIWRIT